MRFQTWQNPPVVKEHLSASLSFAFSRNWVAGSVKHLKFKVSGMHRCRFSLQTPKTGSWAALQRFLRIVTTSHWCGGFLAGWEWLGCRSELGYCEVTFWLSGGIFTQFDWVSFLMVKLRNIIMLLLFWQTSAQRCVCWQLKLLVALLVLWDPQCAAACVLVLPRACSDFLLWQNQKNENALTYMHCNERWGCFPGVFVTIALLNMFTQHLVVSLWLGALEWGISYLWRALLVQVSTRLCSFSFLPNGEICLFMPSLQVQAVTYDASCQYHPTQCWHKICFPSTNQNSIPPFAIYTKADSEPHLILLHMKVYIIVYCLLNGKIVLSSYSFASSVFSYERRHLNGNFWIGGTEETQQITGGTFLSIFMWSLNCFWLPVSLHIDRMWILCLNWLING